MLLGDTDIKESLGKSSLKGQESRWSRHRRSEGDDRRICLGVFHEGLCEGIGIGDRLDRILDGGGY